MLSVPVEEHEWFGKFVENEDCCASPLLERAPLEADTESNETDHCAMELLPMNIQKCKIGW